jgi:hypothetical protein
VFFQQHALNTQLHPFGIVGAGSDMRALAVFVIDRDDRSVLDLDQVKARDKSQTSSIPSFM